MHDQILRVAVAGNPNAGKSTLFNTLTHGREKTGNYPGITIEAKRGDWHDRSLFPPGTGRVELLDLPGAYSLHAHSPEEAVSYRVLSDGAPGSEAPQALIVVVDVMNLERNLFYALQLLELGRPTVVALSMTDRLAAQGGTLQLDRLAEVLGVPVVDVRRDDPATPKRLADALVQALAAPGAERCWIWPDAQVEASFHDLADRLAAATASERRGADGTLGWWLSSQLDAGDIAPEAAPLRTELDALAERNFAGEPGVPARDQMARAAIEARYAWIDRKVAPLLDLPPSAESRSDRIDRVVTHPVAGPLLFLATMGLLFQLMFVGADPLISRIEQAFGALGGWLSEAMPPGPLNDLLVNGIVAGVGSVVVFLPQIAILFALLAFLDGCGYLARAAFLMDRVMARVGLHGKSFVPLLSSFACAIPGIASTRTIERENDRFITILVAPLMTCSARLPVYALLLATFFSDRPAIGGVINQAALGLFLLYFLGTAGALAMAWLLRKTLLPGSRPPLILELPPYRLPRLRDVWYEVRERCIGFAKDAGTVILATTILLWAAMTYPRSPEVEARFDAQLSALHEAAPAADAPIAAVAAHRVQVLRMQQERHHAVTERTVAGRVGHFILPVLKPLGFNEQISIGLIASLAAREVLVSSLGVSYGVGDDEESQGLRMALRNDPRMNRATAISILVWFVFAFQCFATAGAVRRETRSWKWPALLVGYQTVLAWVASFVAYRGALWLGLGGP